MNDNSGKDFLKEIDEAEERVMKRNFEIIDEIDEEIEKLKSEELKCQELKNKTENIRTIIKKFFRRIFR